MTTQTEALKLALEALERCMNQPNYGASWTENAITAIKEALAQQSNEQVEPVAWAENDGDGNVLWCIESCFSDSPEWLDNPMPLYAHPPVPTAQPEQEPVAWITQGGKGWLRWHKSYDDNKDNVPLYTTPPQRTWVGLTDDDCFEALKAVDPEAKRLPLGFSMYAANIQAKFKEKNN